MDDPQLLRYSRHLLLQELGVEGQERLRAAHAVVLGAGGLGSPAAIYLAVAGVGTLTLVDDDRVDLTNLQRQILHTTDRIGVAKADSGRATLRALNPEVAVRALVERADEARLHQILAGADVVLDCTDNAATRYAVNRVCVARGLPLVAGAAVRFDGQLMVFDRRLPDSPCYACLFPEGESQDESCALMGVFAPLTGVIGAMQAGEALKLLAGIGHGLHGRLLLYDALNAETHLLQVARDPQCAVCGRPG